jgi:lysophospholipase L1-like esterase
MIVVVAWALVAQSSAAPTTAVREYVPPQTSSKPVALFLGDSYTVGIGGEGPGWPVPVSRALGWKPVNLAAGGTGYLATAGKSGCGKDYCGAYLEQSTTMKQVPDIVVVAGGRIDPLKGFEDAARTLFQTLRERYPAAKIIAVSPWADDDSPDESYALKAAWIKAAAERADVTYVDSGQPFVGHPEFISADGVHPNTNGYTRLVEVLTPLLADAADSLSGSMSRPAKSIAERQNQVTEALRAERWPSLAGDRKKSEPGEDECVDISARNVTQCAKGDVKSKNVVAVLGDAEVSSYIPTLTQALPTQRIQSLASSRCLAVRAATGLGDADETACEKHRSWAMKWITRHKPQTVFIADSWGAVKRMSDGQADEALQRYATSLTSLSEQLAESGTEVVILSSIPPGRALEACKTPRSIPSECTLALPSAYSDWTRGVEQALNQADASDVHFIRTDKWFCATEECPSFVGNVATFSNDGRLTPAAARAISPLLKQALSAQ